MRNNAFFQNSSPNVMICGIKGIILFKEYMDLSHSKKAKRIYMPNILPLCAKEFFYVASSNIVCGCGMVLSLNTKHYFTLRLGGGKGTNTKA